MNSEEMPANASPEGPGGRPAEQSDVPMVSGKLVISTMVIIGLGMAAFAWWARYAQSQQVLQVWGKEAVVAIRTGKQVLFLKATDAEGDFDLELPTDEGTSRVAFRTEKDISDTPGLIHCRHHLVHQKGFAWEEIRKEGCPPNWTVGLRFLSDTAPGLATSKRQATMLFDFSCNRAFLVERQAEVTMRPIIADALKEFFGELN